MVHSEKDAWHRGTYKTTSNSVAAFDESGAQIGVVFETASPFDTPRLMAELTAWLETERQAGRLHPLLIIGIWVVVFLEVHPFQDGNGRLSRVATTKVAREQLVLAPLPALSLQIIEFARAHGRITIGEALRLTGASRNTLKGHFRSLVEHGHLAQRGGGRGAWYELR